MNSLVALRAASLAAVIAALSLTSCAAPPVSEGAPPTARARLRAAASWAYWLQDVDLESAAACAAPVLVIDPTRDGSSPWTSAEVRRLQRGGRLVLAYLSVGEAEDYRPYWSPSWRQAPPPWLGPENPEWPGNYPVRYWDPAWQELWLAPGGPLRRALEAGFDGVYLDRVDVFEHWSEAGELDAAEAKRRMAGFVQAIARAARDVDSSALVVTQNGSAVAVRPEVLPEIDGLALEDTFFDGDAPQDPEHTREVLSHAEQVRRAQRAVLAVDYCREEGKVASFYRQARARGLIPYATVRDLDRLVPPR